MNRSIHDFFRLNECLAHYCLIRISTAPGTVFLLVRDRYITFPYNLSYSKWPHLFPMNRYPCEYSWWSWSMYVILKVIHPKYSKNIDYILWHTYIKGVLWSQNWQFSQLCVNQLFSADSTMYRNFFILFFT